MVIVFIGLLAAIVVPLFGGQGNQARVATTRANLANLRSAVEVYRMQEGQLPNPLDQLWDGTSPSLDTYIRGLPEEAVTNTAAWFGGMCPMGGGGWLYDGGTGEVNVRLTMGIDCMPGTPCEDEMVDPCGNW